MAAVLSVDTSFIVMVLPFTGLFFHLYPLFLLKLTCFRKVVQVISVGVCKCEYLGLGTPSTTRSVCGVCTERLLKVQCD